jgi:type II restriction/modification system DNA methylase subunit YeeA
MVVKLSVGSSTAGVAVSAELDKVLSQPAFPAFTALQFIQKWKRASNLKERSASQSHFNDICTLIEEPSPTDADPNGTWYTFEKGASRIGTSKGWADVWKKGCFAWEYKGKHKDLGAALAQLQRYAIALDNPPLLVVSDMETIIIHTNFNNSIHQEHRITLDDLGRPDALQKLKNLFTAPQEFDPRVTTVSVTKQAAEAFASIAQYLRNQGFDSRRVAHFMTKLTFCMFAEDIKILPGKVFTQLIKSVEKHPEKFVGKMKSLFAAMKGGGEFGYVDIPWFNGGLFDDNDALALDHDGIRLVLQATQLDWSQIEPSIFGTLFERGLDPSKRSQIGAHYTDPVSIKRIINPVLKEPLEAEWDNTKRSIDLLFTAATQAAKLSKRTKLVKEAEACYERFLRRLCSFRVLDAACGSGNFLYLALVELKNFEHRVRLEGETYGFHRSFHEIGPQNVIGIEVNDYAAELARITIWIGEIQWMIRNGYGVSLSPVLKRLEHIENRDALLNADGTEAEWPAADCIVGNPPFLGNKKILSELGDEYAGRLRQAYKGRVPGGSDFVTYWFEKARTEVEAGKIDRVGLVATNSIRGGSSRKVLDQICSNGHIFCAWSDEPWINEGAAVRVSIVCFQGKSPQNADPNSAGEQAPFCAVPVKLNGANAAEIYSDLTARQEGAFSLDMTTAKPLTENKKIAFQGPVKVGSFDITGEQARKWLELPCNPNGRHNDNVVRPWANGMDITHRPSDTWIIDFRDMAESDAALYQAPFEFALMHVKPKRDGNRDANRKKNWWRHGRSGEDLRCAASTISRYIATPRVAKHRLFTWLDSTVLPDSRLYAICRDDDTTFGILHSRFHEIWSLRTCSWHGVGNDPTYNAASCFETFPFPVGLTPNIRATNYANDPRSRKIAAASKELMELREAWLNPPECVTLVPEVVPGFPERIVPVNERAAIELKKRTLTNLYNQKPQWLLQAHRRLDEAVAAAYGWDADISDEEVLQRLLNLNQRRSVAAVAHPMKAATQKDRPSKPHQQSFLLEYNGKANSTNPSNPAHPQPSQPQASPVMKAPRKRPKVAAGDLLPAID